MPSMPQQKMLRALYTASFCAAFLLSWSQVQAWWVRRYAYDCVSQFVSDEFWGPVAIEVPNNWPYSRSFTLSGVHNVDRAWGFAFMCPIVDESSFPKTDIRVLRVYTYDGHSSDQICAAPCTISASGANSCAAQVCTGNSFVGTKELAVGTVAQAHFRARPEDTAYLMVSMPPLVDPAGVGSHPSVLHGYFQQD